MRWRPAAVDGAVLAALYEVADDGHLPAELGMRGAGCAIGGDTGCGEAVRPGRMRRPRTSGRRCWWQPRRGGTGRCWCCCGSPGLRIGEALGLRRSDLHLMGSSTWPAAGCPGHACTWCAVTTTRTGRGPSPDTARTVAVGPWVLGYYDRYLAERLACPAADGCDFVFVNLFHAPFGAPMTASAVRQLLRGLGRRAGVGRPIRPHMLRHAMGTELAEAEVPIDVIQELLGHQSIITTQRYVHSSQRRLREAVDRIAASNRGRRSKTARRSTMSQPARNQQRPASSPPGGGARRCRRVAVDDRLG